MNNCYFSGPGHYEIRDTLIPEPGDHDVLVKVTACGVCGTDIHIFHGSAPAAFPLIPGHEFTGEIVSCGKKVKRLSINDVVTVDPNIACGYCQYCREGKINFCENLQAIGVTRDGGFAQYVVVPELQAYPIDKKLDPLAAAFAEPLSCCLHGMDVISIRPGERVLIAGGGAIGLIMLQLVKQAGALVTGLVEPEPFKRGLAGKLGADFTLSPGDQNAETIVRDYTCGGPDVVIECAGHRDALQQCFQLAKTGTRILLFGLAPKEHSIDLNLQKFFKKELILKSSLLNPNTFQRANTLLESGKISVADFTINRMPLTADAFASVFTSQPKVSSLKNILIPNH